MASEDIVIPLIMVILIIIFLIYIVIILIHSNWQRTASATPGDSPARTSSDQAAVTLFQCLPQQCAVNLATGLKRCGTAGEVVTVNPAIEVCSDPFTCSNPVLPYAVQSDGSTNNLGQCQAGIECGCLRQPRCPQYVTSYFTRSNGDPYQDPQGQRITFPQVGSYINLNNGEVVNSPPLSYTDPNISFCAAPVDWLPFSTPGCNFVGSSTMSYADLAVCMGAAKGCDGVTFNPCLQGTLAVITGDPGSINQLTVLNQEVACVAGSACDCGETAIYDTNFGGLVCRKLLPPPPTTTTV